MDKCYFITVLFVVFVWVAGALRIYSSILFFVHVGQLFKCVIQVPQGGGGGGGRNGLLKAISHF